MSLLIWKLDFSEVCRWGKVCSSHIVSCELFMLSFQRSLRGEVCSSSLVSCDYFVLWFQWSLRGGSMELCPCLLWLVRAMITTVFFFNFAWKWQNQRQCMKLSSGTSRSEVRKMKKAVYVGKQPQEMAWLGAQWTWDTGCQRLVAANHKCPAAIWIMSLPSFVLFCSLLCVCRAQMDICFCGVLFIHELWWRKFERLLTMLTYGFAKQLF